MQKKLISSEYELTENVTFITKLTPMPTSGESPTEDVIFASQPQISVFLENTLVREYKVIQKHLKSCHELLRKILASLDKKENLLEMIDNLILHTSSFTYKPEFESNRELLEKNIFVDKIHTLAQILFPEEDQKVQHCPISQLLLAIRIKLSQIHIPSRIIAELWGSQEVTLTDEKYTHHTETFTELYSLCKSAIQNPKSKSGKDKVIERNNWEYNISVLNHIHRLLPYTQEKSGEIITQLKDLIKMIKREDLCEIGVGREFINILTNIGSLANDKLPKSEAELYAKCEINIFGNNMLLLRLGQLNFPKTSDGEGSLNVHNIRALAKSIVEARGDTTEEFSDAHSIFETTRLKLNEDMKRSKDFFEDALHLAEFLNDPTTSPIGDCGLQRLKELLELNVLQAQHLTIPSTLSLLPKPIQITFAEWVCMLLKPKDNLPHYVELFKKEGINLREIAIQTGSSEIFFHLQEEPLHQAPASLLCASLNGGSPIITKWLLEKTILSAPTSQECDALVTSAANSPFAVCVEIILDELPDTLLTPVVLHSLFHAAILAQNECVILLLLTKIDALESETQREVVRGLHPQSADMLSPHAQERVLNSVLKTLPTPEKKIEFAMNFIHLPLNWGILLPELQTIRKLTITNQHITGEGLLEFLKNTPELNEITFRGSKGITFLPLTASLVPHIETIEFMMIAPEGTKHLLKTFEKSLRKIIIRIPLKGEKIDYSDLDCPNLKVIELNPRVNKDLLAHFQKQMGALTVVSKA